MGCRSRVMGNVYEPSREVSCGRGNLSFTTINLPRLGIEAHGDLQKFFSMLDDRIDAAYRYLAEHPESRCVASGGQNDNEPISEASCIRNTLVARGIHPDRIYLEDRSRSTEENLRFTAEIIRQQGLNPRVAIASDNFHQLRASVWAGRCGLEAESLGCASWWPLGPGYWAREAVAVVVLEVGSLLQGG